MKLEPSTIEIMNQSLTSGAVKALVGLEANTMVDPNFKPILQVINLKMLGKNKVGADRYRVSFRKYLHYSVRIYFFRAAYV